MPEMHGWPSSIPESAPPLDWSSTSAGTSTGGRRDARDCAGIVVDSVNSSK